MFAADALLIIYPAWCRSRMHAITNQEILH